MTNHAHELPASCPNCGHPVSGPYCSQCGQKVVIETPTLWEFIHEYLHHYVAIDGTLTRTLKLLVTRPGKLTTEFLAGRRASYIKPLQLYLTISFIFFIALAIFSGHRVSGSITAPTGDTIYLTPRKPASSTESPEDKAARENIARAKAAAARGAGTDEYREVSISTWLESHPMLAPLAKRWKERKSEYEGNSRLLTKKMFDDAPYGVFGLVPVVAFLLWVMYRRRGLRYGVHLVFSFHLHAFVFLLFLLSLLPYDMGGWILLAVFTYLVMSLKQVYGGRWHPQVLRAAILLGAYFILAIVAMVAVFLFAFLA